MEKKCDIQEKPEHESVCKLLNRSWSRVEFVSFFEREVEEVPKMG